MKHIKIVILLFSIAVISLGIVQFTSIHNSAQYTKDIESSNLRTKKISEAYFILNLLLDVETGSRGYLLTAIPKFLEPYSAAEKILPNELEKFYKYLSAEQIKNLSSLVKIRLDSANALIHKKMNKQPISSYELEEGKRVMDDLRRSIRNIVDNEESYLAEHMQGKQSFYSNSIFQLAGGSIFSFFVIGLTAYFVYAEFKKRSQAEKDLQMSLATSEAISGGIDFGVITADTNGNIIFANKWVMSKAKAQVKTIEDFFSSNILMYVPLKKMLAGEIDSIDQAELSFNNEKFIMHITSSPFKIKDEVKGILLSIVDTTEAVQKMAILSTGKREAEKASSNKSDFLAKMSHEIRTPLNAILGVGDILKLTKLNEEQERCLDIFQRSAQTLNNLVNDILDLSKIEAGKIDINNAPFSLTNLVFSCTSIMDFRASQKGLLFVSENQCLEDHYIGDENRIRQIILNIIGNAIKFTEDGEINFKIKSIDRGNGKRELRFIVKDSGRGISEKNIGKLFTNYQQEHSKISSEFGGTGLGLSLSRELAKLMNGDIELQSELGKGSEFTFFTTLAVAAKGEFVEENFDTNVSLSKIKILLVDDNEENRFIVKRYLHDFDLEIYEAIDGEDAIETFKREKFDLVFMDINMPKKDGITATTEIREWEREVGQERTCIIALSANALSQEFKKAQVAGCDDYLTKPIARFKLITTINKWMGRSKTKDQKMNDDIDNEEEIDEELLALVPAYLENRKKDVVLLLEAVAKKDIGVVGKISHNIKGTALSYGQSDLDKIAQVLNAASKDVNWPEIEKAVTQIANLLGVKNGN